MAGEELDLVRIDVGLHAQSIVLVFEGGSPDSLEDRLERLEPFREHRADRTEQLQVDLIEAIDALRCEDPRDFPEVGHSMYPRPAPPPSELVPEVARDGVAVRLAAAARPLLPAPL